MIGISPEAIAQIKSLGQLTIVRVSVAGGGCSGLSYKLAFEPNPIDPTDKAFEKEGVTVVTDAKSYLFIAGCTLEYSGGLQGRGFYVTNPRATQSCGCGDSFNC